MAKLYQRPRSSYWWCSFKHPDGTLQRKSTGVPIGQPRNAELRASKMELEVWENDRPGRSNRQYIFDELMVEWVESTRPGSAEINCIIRLRDFFGGQVMNDLSRSDIQGYKQYRAACKWHGKFISESTIRRELGTFGSSINWAIKHLEWDIPNPVSGSRPKASKPRIRWATPAEAALLIKNCKKKTGTPWLADFVELGFNTGMRKMEILGCELSRVDMLNNCIHLRPEDQKNGRHDSVPLNKNARRAIMRRLSYLAEHLPNSKWLFPSKFHQTGDIHMSDPRKAFNAACRESDIKNFRPHDMRHTFASWLVQRGVPLIEIKEAMRHSDVKQTEKYAHLSPNVSRRVVAVLDGENLAHYMHTELEAIKTGVEIAENIIENQQLSGRSGRI